MSWSLIRLEDMKPQAWRNGGGTTRELLALPPSESGEWTIRMSVAEVESDGPFSSFPGVDRWFAVLKGEGVMLKIGGETQAVRARGEPTRFDGGAAVDCTLIAGATQDFNLMVREGAVRDASRMLRVRNMLATTSRGRGHIAIYANQPARVSSEGAHIELPAQSLAWRAIDNVTTFEIESEDALWMEVNA